MINEFAHLNASLATATGTQLQTISARMAEIVGTFKADFPKGKLVSFFATNVPTSASAVGTFNVVVADHDDCPSLTNVLGLATPIYKSLVEGFGCTTPQQVSILARKCGGLILEGKITLREKGSAWTNKKSGETGICLKTTFNFEPSGLKVKKETPYMEFLDMVLMGQVPVINYSWYAEEKPDVAVRSRLGFAPQTSAAFTAADDLPI